MEMQANVLYLKNVTLQKRDEKSAEFCESCETSFDKNKVITLS